MKRKSHSAPSPIRRFLPYYAKYRKTMALDLFCALLTTFCALAFPVVVRYITDAAVQDLARLTVRSVLIIAGVYILLRVVDAAANYYMQNIGHVMGAHIETDMRRDLFAHLQKLDFSYYSDTKVGQIMARITGDLFEITEFAHHCPEEFFIAGVQIGATFVILATYNIWLTLTLFALIPLMLLCARYFKKRMTQAFRARREQVGEINAQVEDALLGMRVVQSFTAERIETEKFARGNERFLDIYKDTYRHMAGYHSVIRIFDGIMYATVIALGTVFLIVGQISVGEYTAYLLFVTTLLNSIRRVVEFAEQFQRGRTGIERFFTIMDEPIRIADLPDAVELRDVCGDIEFCDVTFRYDADAQQVLSHLNLTIRAGENIAIVGPSGGGKTTMCNLIPRFYEIDGGQIRIDGVDNRHVTVQSLRANIGTVQQDVYLFAGTVAENIAYGRPGATIDEIWDAARKAGAEDFIRDLPDGMDTYVGERGVKLSGGQKQRISIARVFLKDPPILILDEATSALDNESERLIQRSLEQLCKGRTAITVAHRLSTVRNADRIVVLTKDGIAEVGSHDELVAAHGIYAHMLEI